LHWVLRRLGDYEWDLYGCMSTEDRSASVCDQLASNGILGSARMANIAEPHGHRKSGDIAARKAMRRGQLEALVGPGSFEDHNLLEPYSAIVESGSSFTTHSKGKIALDI